MEAKAEGRCVRCEKILRAMLKNKEGHHSDNAVKKRGRNCDVKELRCASLRSALQRCGALSTTIVFEFILNSLHKLYITSIVPGCQHAQRH